MILLQQAVNEIEKEKLKLLYGSMKNPSMGSDGHSQYIQNTGVFKGLEIALEILQGLLQGGD